ncbi:MAG: pyridoxamine 5'-phosphate oxidase family protein [Thermoleophilia bacterium]
MTTRSEAVGLLRSATYGVLATTFSDGRPHAAVVGVAVTDELELVFDTVRSSRKAQNLERDPRCAFSAWAGAITVQLEGRADVLAGVELERLRRIYLDAFPDGRERALVVPGLIWVRVRPDWTRLSDYATDPPRVELVP